MNLSTPTAHNGDSSKSLDTILFLISQELKIRRLFAGFRQAGIHDLDFEPYLDRIILAEMGLEDSNEMMERYFKVIEKRSRKIRADNESVMRQSLKVYMELKGRGRR